MSSHVISSLSFFVPIYPVLFGVSVSFFLYFLLASLLVSCSLRILFLFLFDVIFVKMCKSLDHRVNFLVILVHEHLFERTLGWKVQSLKQVGLTALVDGGLIVERLDFLLGLERKRFRDSLWNREWSKNSFISFSVYILVMDKIL